MEHYATSGTCAREIQFEVQDNTITQVDFVSGCPGNLLGMKSLVEGQSPQDVIEKLKGIRCGNKNTSCPDQLAQALEAYVASN